MKAHFFIDESGVLKVITDMPGEPSPIYPADKASEYYQSALKAAKDKALEVDNKEEVLDKLWRSDERINGPIPFLHWKENMLPYPKDTIYSLEGCNIKVKTKYDPCNNPKCDGDGFVKGIFGALEFCPVCKGSGGINGRKLALITFSESKPMNDFKKFTMYDDSKRLIVTTPNTTYVPPLPVEDKEELKESAPYVLSNHFMGELSNKRYREVLSAMEEYASIKVKSKDDEIKRLTALAMDYRNQIEEFTRKQL